MTFRVAWISFYVGLLATDVFQLASSLDAIGLKIRFTRLVCLDHPYQVTTLERCELKFVRNGGQPQASISVRYEGMEQAYASVGLFVKSIRYRPLFPPQSFDVCEILGGHVDQINPVSAYVLDGIKKYAAHLFDRPCPLKGFYNITALGVPENYTLALVPPGDYYVAFRIYDDKNRTGLHLHAYLSFRQTGLFG